MSTPQSPKAASPRSAGSPGQKKSPTAASPVSPGGAATGLQTTDLAVLAAIDAAPLEVDDAHAGTDNDSAIDERLSSYTQSLTSSVMNYPSQYGRRYHAFRSGAYAFPNDEAEVERLDMNHIVMVKLIGNKLFLAPIEEEKMLRVLDMGTGTGIWAIEMGDMYPSAEIIGNDLSPIQSPWVPPNVKFEVDDIESPWVGHTKYDFIFGRYLTASIADWPKLVANTFENLNSGGWVEFQDYDLQYYSEDNSLKETHSTMKWIRSLLEAANMLGRDPQPGPKLEGWVKDAGFVNVKAFRFRLPIGPWPLEPLKKDVGMCNLIQVLDGLEAFTLKLFCGVLGWKEAEVMVLLAKVRNELRSDAFHAQFDFHVVYGQKP